MSEIELPERLEGDGFVLRPLRESDAAAYATAFRDDPSLGRLLGFDDDPDEAWARDHAGRGHERAVADPQTDAFLGLVLLHSYTERHRRAEVAFWLVPEARRRGLGSAAVRLIVDWAMRELDLLRMELTTTPDNAATEALARRLGFTREGVLRERNIERGRRVDVVFYGLLREEWPGT